MDKPELKCKECGAVPTPADRRKWRTFKDGFDADGDWTCAVCLKRILDDGPLSDAKLGQTSKEPTNAK